MLFSSDKILYTTKQNRFVLTFGILFPLVNSFHLGIVRERFTAFTL